MRHFDASQVAQLADYQSLAQAMGTAFADPTISVPQRVHLPTSDPATGSVLLMMPAWRANGPLIIKLVTVTPPNSARDLPTVQGILHVLDAATGRPLATMEATELTRRRTAATSLLAARLLARPASKSMLMVGAGAMARHLLQAYCTQYPLERIQVWNRTRERVKDLVTTTTLPTDTRVEICDGLPEAVGEADIISCATLSDRPLIRGAWVRPGTHVDLVGAFRPGMRESDEELLRRARIYVDTLHGALTEAGDLIQAIDSRAIAPADVVGELADLATGRCPGRDSEDAITVFKSVGSAIEDLAAAELVLKRAGGLPATAQSFT